MQLWGMLPLFSFDRKMPQFNPEDLPARHCIKFMDFSVKGENCVGVLGMPNLAISF
jgi:hypothetical protein